MSQVPVPAAPLITTQADHLITIITETDSESADSGTAAGAGTELGAAVTAVQVSQGNVIMCCLLLLTSDHVLTAGLRDGSVRGAGADRAGPDRGAGGGGGGHDDRPDLNHRRCERVPDRSVVLT